MSTYTNFFLRKGDMFIPVGSFSRNSSIYRIANVGTWEKIAPLSRERLDNLIRAAGDEIRRIEKDVLSVREKIKEISMFNNSVEDKIKCIAEYERDLDMLDEELDKMSFAKNYFIFLSIAAENADGREGIDANKFVYAGLEIANPTLDDLANK